MGQGYSLTTLSAGSAGIDVPELSDLTHEASLGNARFMKSIRARHHDGLVVAKVVMKPYASMKFDKYIKEIEREKKIIVDIPNALNYHRVFETSSNGYLVRQYIYSSLYDRLSTRPFLEDIEKRWLSFQLLCAVRDCHAQNLYHGDIKTENTLVTSWGWLYLTDFSSSYKPTYLPEDDPADFSFYFDISGRRTCYLAPERFLSPGETSDRGGITWAMDIFSVGCVIAELFLEGPIFNLSQLFRHRRGELNVDATVLSRIEDVEIRELIAHMVQVEPEARYSADEYLNFWRHKAFPEYFYSFLHQYMHVITDPTLGRSPITSEKENLGESDDRIDRVYFDYDKISFLLGYTSDDIEDNERLQKPGKLLFDPFPLHLDLPERRITIKPLPYPTLDDGTVLFLNIVTSSVRSTARSTSKVRACELLLVFSQRISDESKMNRVLPFLIDLINDPVDIVKIAALRAVAQLLAIIKTASPTNAYLFRQYVLPRLESFRQSLASSSDASEIDNQDLDSRNDSSVKITMASCVASLAEAAAHFLDIIQSLKVDGLLPSSNRDTDDGSLVYPFEDLFDPIRADLVKFFETYTKNFLTDPDAEVRKAFLGSVSSLCIFFGSAQANDIILSHMNTYLNEDDWRLKCAFFEAAVGVAVYLGATNYEEFMLPVMIQALSEPEESVVLTVLRSMAAVAQLGLIQRSTATELVDLVARLMMHPNTWIREAAAYLVGSATKYASQADIQCLVIPLLRPYLRNTPLNLTEVDILDNLKRPLPRPVFEAACTWAKRDGDNGSFWKSARQRPSSRGQELFHMISSRDLAMNTLTRIPKTQDDQQWIQRLRLAGMTNDDEFKLVALRDFIWRTTRLRPEDNAGNGKDLRLKEIVSLQKLGVQAELVLFDHEKQALADPADVVEADYPENQPQTIADALLDASTSLPDASSGAQAPTSELIRATKKPVAGASPRISSPLSASPARSPLIGGATATPHDASSTKSTQRDASVQQSSDGGNFDGVKDLPPHRHASRPQNTAMQLMSRQTSGGKAIAETSTSSASAHGRVHSTGRNAGLPRSSITRAQEAKTKHPSAILFKDAHNYEGRDPSILELLDSLYLENYPLDNVEFGPIVTPIDRRQWDTKQSGNTRWKPKGTLIATLGEHTAAVGHICVAPDHTFFITGSDDGTVKVWDCSRLERNLAHSSRQTHQHDPGTKITSLTFIGNTHSFVSAANDGSIHVVKVDVSESSGGAAKYGRLRVLRKYKLPNTSGHTGQQSHAVYTSYFKQDSQSILLIATNTSQIYAFDLRSMSIVYTLTNPTHHGIPTTFCTDRNHFWLLVGTSHGILDFWDLRFRLRVRSWAFPAGAPVTRICPHPIKNKSAKLALVAGGTGHSEVSVWDVEKGIVREVYRASGTRSTTDHVAARDAYAAFNPDAADSSTSMLSRLADTGGSEIFNNPASAPSGDSSVSIRALAAGARSSDPGRDSRYGFFVAAGGADRKVRFWDMDRVEASCVVSGLEAEEAQPTYRASLVGGQGDTVLCEERASSTNSGLSDGTSDRGGPNVGKGQSPGKKRDAGHERGGTAAAGERGKAPRSTVISLQQQALLKSHLDGVLDVALLEYPFNMVVSSDQSGMVYVFS